MLTLTNGAFVLVYQVGLLEGWWWGSLVVFHDKGSCARVFIVNDEFEFFLGVGTFGVGTDYMFEDAFVGLVCVCELVFVVNMVEGGLVVGLVVVLGMEIF